MEITKSGKYITPVIKAQMACFEGLVMIARDIDEFILLLEREKSEIIQSHSIQIYPINSGYGLIMIGDTGGNYRKITELKPDASKSFAKIIRFRMSFQPESFFNEKIETDRSTRLEAQMVPRENSFSIERFTVNSIKDLAKARDRFRARNRELLVQHRKAIIG